jgi:hypothetical protein
MATEQQKFHSERRRCEQFFNAAVIRFRGAVNTQRVPAAERAATDLLQVIDEMLMLVGLPALTGEDCPDCGQFIPDAVDILAEGEGE